MAARCMDHAFAHGRGNDYPLRRLARGFAVVGVAVAAYAAALVLIAVSTAIIEF